MRLLPALPGRALTLLILASFAIVTTRSVRADAPVELNGVMLQAFYWNVPQKTPAGSWWKNLEQKAGEFKDAGFTAVWLPPPYKGASGTSDVGYGVYDRYDLGEFDQKGAVATRYGTLAELQSTIDSLHGQHVEVYADIVMNHMMGADASDEFDYSGRHFNVPTKFNFTARGNKYSNYTWQYYNFNGVQAGDGSWQNWKGGWDFAPYSGDAVDNLMGCEIRYLDENNRNEMVAWGQWLTAILKLDGYRLDATKHIYTPFVNQWLDTVKGQRFAVSEAQFYDIAKLQDYAVRTGRRTSLFDFPLHGVFATVLNANGPGDLRNFRFAGYTEVDGPLSVSFVDNHDTDNNGGAVFTQKMLAYAYILMRDKGYPCVFYKDYYEYGLGPEIKRLMQIRRDHAHGPSWEHDETDADVYVYSRAGDAQHTGLLLVLCDQNAPPKRVRTPFANAHLRDLTGNQTAEVVTDAQGSGTFPVTGRSYSVWSPVPAMALTAVVAPVANIAVPLNTAPLDPNETRGAIAAPTDPFQETVNRVTYLEQGWTSDESNQFHFTAQGSQIIPYEWFVALEQVDSTTLFRDNQNMLKYRYLVQSATPANQQGLPIGFVRDGGVSRDWLGMTCAACHTNEIHYQGVAYRVDGAPTQGDVQAFLSDMIASLQQTQQDSQKFGRFVSRLPAAVNTPEGLNRLRAEIEAMLAIRIGYNRRNFPNYDPSQISPLRPPASFGRLDAVDAIVNEAFHLAIRNPDPANPTQESQPANAPVSYPFLWDTPRHKKVEWLGIAQSGGLDGVLSLGRNVGEVVGVFGDVTIPDNPSLLTFGYRSSVKIDELRALESLIAKLISPQWPATFPPIDQPAAQAGAQIYNMQCASCHKVIDRADPGRSTDEMMSDEKTDPQAAINFFSRVGSSGKLRGTPVNLVPFTRKFSDQASAGDMLTNVVVGTILGGVHGAPPDQLERITFQRPPSQTTFALPSGPTAQYKARPLNGIWATAPYLHNGSVPNLDALLRPAAQRPKSFNLGSRRFDPVRVGFETDGGNFPRFNVNQPDGTAIVGNSNAGHDWGTNLDDLSRRQLLEYLKSL